MNQTTSNAFDFTIGSRYWLRLYRAIMPHGAGVLFLVQMSSILSFSVLYSTLILYATKGLHMSDARASAITGAFLALNYFLHLMGGYIGGRYFSYRSLFLISMSVEILGCALISVPDTSFLLWGLAAFLSGCGLNITCINCLLTQLFAPDDKNRETSFLWNYSGQNIGFFVGFLVAGYFDLNQSYHALFLLSAVGNLAAIILMLWNWNLLHDRETRFTQLTSAGKHWARISGIGIISLLILALRILLENTSVCNMIIIAVTAVMFCFIAVLARQQSRLAERNKMLAYLGLALAAIIFWTLILIGPMGLNLFTERNVDRHLFGITLAPEWVLNMNNFVVIFGAPIVSMLFIWLRKRGINIGIPLQFSFALLIIGVSFAILPLGIHFADARGYSSVNWVLASYTLQSIGDLFLSPVGYAMVGQLAPKHLRGLMMGTWLMFGGITGVLADYLSRLAAGTANSIDPLVTNASYSHTFNLVGWSAITAGVILLLFVPVMARLTQEK